MTKPRCTGIAKDISTGKPKPCKNPAMKGGFCRWHQLDATRETRATRDQWLAGAQRALLAEDCIVAVKQIAAGHGDPMTLCRNVINRFAKKDA